MKKTVMLAMAVLAGSLLFCASASAIAIGDLDESLRVNLNGACVRPILIFSDADKLNIYISGDMVKSATILSQGQKRVYVQPKQPDRLYIEGGLYFDFKDEKVRAKIVEKLKGMIRLHEENVKANQETGKEIPSPESPDSYFYGSFVPGTYTWGYSGIPSHKETFDNFRFLTMRITVTLPFSQTDWTYDPSQMNLSIDRRCFHSGKPLNICSRTEQCTGIVDPGFSMSPTGNQGQLFLNVNPDRHAEAQLRGVFEGIINSIVAQIIKTRKTLPVREF